MAQVSESEEHARGQSFGTALLICLISVLFGVPILNIFVAPVFVLLAIMRIFVRSTTRVQDIAILLGGLFVWGFVQYASMNAINKNGSFLFWALVSSATMCATMIVLHKKSRIFGD